MIKLAIALGFAAVFLGIVAIIMHGWDMQQRKGNTTIIYFYAPWCGYCKKFFPLWNELKQENTDVNMVEINSDEQEAMCKKYNVTRYPTLIKVSGKNKKVFNEERTKENLIKFIQYK